VEGPLRNLLEEAIRRKVFRFAALYIVIAWVALQVADLAFPGLDVPERAIRYVWAGAFLLFPLVLVFGWRYDITTRGIVRTPPADGIGKAPPLARSDHVLLSCLTIGALGILAMLSIRIVDTRQAPAAASVREISPNSIAVLPLENLTGNPEQEYFVAGMHDALITVLSKINSLKVISRTSVNAYKAAAKTLPEIAQELRVARLVEGSVYREGDNVRITVQLIDGATDAHLWADSYEREISNILSMQADMARAIAQQIEVKIRPGEQFTAAAREVDPETYELYLKGMYHLYQFTPDGMDRGMTLLREAVTRNPADPLAYSGLALGYNEIGHSSGPRSAFPKAKAAAETALKLDPSSAEAHAAMAEALVYFDWQWDEAERYFTRALELNPSLPQALGHYAYLLNLLGRTEESLAHMEQARQVDPLSPVWAAFACWLYMLDDRFDEAIAACEEGLLLTPDFPLALYCLGQVYTAQGKIEEGVATHERLPVGHPMRNWALGPTYAMAGRREEAVGIVEKMLVDPGPKDLLHAALTYAALGDTDEAVRRLEIAYEARVDWFPWIAVFNSYGSALEGLRDDPRFQALVARLDLPDAP
jgi:TolB-like protein/Flp pilus assembly protein TadD